jgi:hypothetical protein
VVGLAVPTLTFRTCQTFKKTSLSVAISIHQAIANSMSGTLLLMCVDLSEKFWWSLPTLLLCLRPQQEVLKEVQESAAKLILVASKIAAM